MKSEHLGRLVETEDGTSFIPSGKRTRFYEVHIHLNKITIFDLLSVDPNLIEIHFNKRWLLKELIGGMSDETIENAVHIEEIKDASIPL